MIDFDWTHGCKIQVNLVSYAIHTGHNLDYHYEKGGSMACVMAVSFS